MCQKHEKTKNESFACALTPTKIINEQKVTLISACLFPKKSATDSCLVRKCTFQMKWRQLQVQHVPFFLMPTDAVHIKE
jgi:hypothetical protein